MKILSGSSNFPLAQSLAQALNIPLVPVDIDWFANGEKRVYITEDLHGESVILVQSHSNPADNHVMEMLFLLDALERMGVKEVFSVIPWLGYSLQDKVFRSGEPLAAKVVANVISNSYTHRVFMLDLHNASETGFFSVPTSHLSALSLFTEYAQNNLDLTHGSVASPDFGGLKKAKTFAEALNLPLVNIDKQRDLNTGEVSAEKLHGDVAGKSVLLFDDVINSGSTAIEAAKLLKENGANEIFFFATHGLFVNDALDKINDSHIDQVIITNSVKHTNLPSKISVLDSTPIFARALKNWL